MATIHLSDADKAFIDEQVEAGTFRDADDVVRASLTLLRSRQARVTELRALIKEGDDDIAARRVYSYDSAEALLADIRKLEPNH
ncbi:type II toxin-antitoxin system ParD family antitoxin [Rhizobium sp. RAF56]|jgi:antitoxin ParD1/3/4|uniref:type II toxin-antitoxin system ParD family antitoxin n=1 Tax=Rhizobium sp. RAF56 TaxID=3233062 RepID=UPI003F9938D3